MPDLDVILNRLREAAADDFIHQRPYVPLADAEFAVREARDATVQEMLGALCAADGLDLALTIDAAEKIDGPCTAPCGHWTGCDCSAGDEGGTGR